MAICFDVHDVQWLLVLMYEVCNGYLFLCTRCAMAIGFDV